MFYASFDTRVTNLTISEGAYAQLGEQMFTLIDARTWWALGNAFNPRYPVRVRVENPTPELFRIGESAVVSIRGN